MALAGKKKPKKLLFPMDYGDMAARKRYKRSGIVITYLKGEIPTEANITFENFLKIEDASEAQQVLRQLVAGNSDSKLAEHWGVPLHRIKTLRSDLGLIKNRTGELIEVKEPEKWGGPRRQRKSAAVPRQKVTAIGMAAEIPEKEFQIMLKGTFSVDELNNRLEAMRLMLPAVSCSFNVEICLQEVK